MGRRKLYMIHTMTDETYAVNCTLDLPKKEKEDTMFLVALFSRYYWIVGSVLGGILGQIIPFDLTGLDFCMTALFLIIFIDQWEKAEKHTLALTGLGIGVICLLIFGENRFMLPALLIATEHANNSPPADHHSFLLIGNSPGKSSLNALSEFAQ